MALNGILRESCTKIKYLPCLAFYLFISRLPTSMYRARYKEVCKGAYVQNKEVRSRKDTIYRVKLKIVRRGVMWKSSRAVGG